MYTLKIINSTVFFCTVDMKYQTLDNSVDQKIIDKIVQIHTSNKKDKDKKKKIINILKNGLPVENLNLNLADGWYWIEIKTKDELVREAEIMNHCLYEKRYYDKFLQKSHRYFSLRTPEDKPKITVELDVQNKVLVQYKANSNQAPNKTCAKKSIPFFHHIKEYVTRISEEDQYFINVSENMNEIFGIIK